MSTPKEHQDEAQRAIGYGPIWLRRVGDYVIVEVEFDGEWVEVIREQLDGNFSHCIYPIGIQDRMSAAHHKRGL